MLAYMTSGLEVSYWLMDGKNNVMQKFTGYLNEGFSFQEAYRKSEGLSPVKRSRQLPANPLRRPDNLQNHE